MKLDISVDGAAPVSGLLLVPSDAGACLVLAHGAGAGMLHPFMAAVAEGLAARRVATLRYQFPYMEKASKRPDRPAVAQATVRAAVVAAARHAPGLSLFAGGKSFGGRMTSQAQAQAPLPGVHGLVFLGFPLHLAKAPSTARAAHLTDVSIPMLFVQGTRDALADPDLLAATAATLGRADLVAIEAADHSFHVPVRSGRRDPDVLDAVLDRVATWMFGISGARCPIADA